MQYPQIIPICILMPALVLTGCAGSQPQADAYGNFEVEETIISARAAGELLRFDVEEGDLLAAGRVVGYIDSSLLVIRKKELRANMAAIAAKRTGISAERQVLQAELDNLDRELLRLRKLLRAEAATQKQVDDLEGSIRVAKRKMAALESQYAVVDAQFAALEQKQAQLDEQIDRCRVVNPRAGLVLAKLARQHELVAPGKPLYKIADMDRLYLKAYISEPQLTSFRTGQEVTVIVDEGEGVREIPGRITWVSAEAEFTPKIIQTKEERVNLVYAIKVAVENDGTLKIGQPGEVHLR